MSLARAATPAAARYPRAGGRGLPVSTVTEAGLAQTQHPQGVVAVCGHLHTGLEEVLSAAPALAVVLAEIRDPGNAGTVLRSADAAGADAVVFSERSVDPYNGKRVRVGGESVPPGRGARRRPAAGVDRRCAAPGCGYLAAAAAVCLCASAIAQGR